MVGHQRPGQAFGAGLYEEFGKAPEESCAIGIVAEDVATIHAADDHVLQQVGNIDAGGSWYVGRAANGKLVNK